MRRAIAIAMLVAACGTDPEATDTAEPSSTSTSICSDAPITTWDNFGSGFVVENCQACHASTSNNRFGAPIEVTFDDEEQVWALVDRVLARVADDQTMPPQGGVTDDDRYLLEVWLVCGG